MKKELRKKVRKALKAQRKGKASDADTALLDADIVVGQQAAEKTKTGSIKDSQKPNKH